LQRRAAAARWAHNSQVAGSIPAGATGFSWERKGLAVMQGFFYLVENINIMSDKVVIVASSFYPKNDDRIDFREIPDLDKLINEGWKIVSVNPVVSHQSTQSGNLGSMQLIIRLQK
jgi:hypothetical protein